MKTNAVLTLITAALTLTACDRPPNDAPNKTPEVSAEMPRPASDLKTLETSRLGRAIDTYSQEATPLNRADVEKAFAELNGEIAELEERARTTTGSDRDEALAKARSLTAYKHAEELRFTAVRVLPNGDALPPVDTRSGAQKIEDGAKDAASSVEDAAKDAADAIGDAMEKAGDTIKDSVRDRDE